MVLVGSPIWNFVTGTLYFRSIDRFREQALSALLHDLCMPKCQYITSRILLDDEPATRPPSAPSGTGQENSLVLLSVARARTFPSGSSGATAMWPHAADLLWASDYDQTLSTTSPNNLACQSIPQHPSSMLAAQPVSLDARRNVAPWRGT